MCSENSNGTVGVETIPLANMPFTVRFPINGDTVNNLTSVYGYGAAGARVDVIIDGNLYARTYVEDSGNWNISVSIYLSEGRHCIKAVQLDDSGVRQICGTVEIILLSPVLPPSIEYPSYGSRINDFPLTISGRATPGNIVAVCLTGRSCENVVAFGDGSYSFTVPDMLSPGEYLITATQQNNLDEISPPAYLSFAFI
jgi:hypothetical protein